MTNTKLLLSVAAASVLALNGCGGGSSSTSNNNNNSSNTAECTSYTVPAGNELAGDITTCTQLTADRTWIIDGLVAVKGTTLKIDAGTTLAGREGTGAATSYMVVDKGAKIMAEGTAAQPIIFTSEIAANGGASAVGQWGGLTLIGNAGNAQVGAYEVNSEFVPGTSDMADNSGVLTYVQILNSGITMAQDKEINGLSLVGVGSGTTIQNITVVKSDDDCVEAWGGTVNMSNITVSECTDDHFDIDDGYSGTVTNLVINQSSGNAAMEMSGDTAATFNGFTITQNASAKEGGIYFKNAGIGGHFNNGTVNDNSADGFGAIHSKNTADIANTSFTNVTLNGNNADDLFTGDSAADLEARLVPAPKVNCYDNYVTLSITLYEGLQCDFHPLFSPYLYY